MELFLTSYMECCRGHSYVVFVSVEEKTKHELELYQGQASYGFLNLNQTYKTAFWNAKNLQLLSLFCM